MVGGDSKFVLTCTHTCARTHTHNTHLETKKRRWLAKWGSGLGKRKLVFFPVSTIKVMGVSSSSSTLGTLAKRWHLSQVFTYWVVSTPAEKWLPNLRLVGSFLFPWSRPPFGECVWDLYLFKFRDMSCVCVCVWEHVCVWAQVWSRHQSWEI